MRMPIRVKLDLRRTFRLQWKYSSLTNMHSDHKANGSSLSKLCLCYSAGGSSSKDRDAQVVIIHIGMLQGKRVIDPCHLMGWFWQTTWLRIVLAVLALDLHELARLLCWRPATYVSATPQQKCDKQESNNVGAYHFFIQQNRVVPGVSECKTTVIASLYVPYALNKYLHTQKWDQSGWGKPAGFDLRTTQAWLVHLAYGFCIKV